MEQTYSNIEILIVDDCSTDEYSRLLIDGLSANKRDRLRVLTPPGNLGLAGARNFGIVEAKGNYIIPLDADDLLDRRFIHTAVQALENNPQFDFVVTPAAYFPQEGSMPSSDDYNGCNDYAVFVGEANVSGATENRFSTATAVFRSEIIKSYRYQESLSCFEDWNLYLRLVQNNHRAIVSTDVYFFYRNRADSMVKESEDPVKQSMFAHDNLRTAMDMSKATPLSYLGYIASVPRPETVTEEAGGDIIDLRRQLDTTRQFLQEYQALWSKRGLMRRLKYRLIMHGLQVIDPIVFFHPASRNAVRMARDHIHRRDYEAVRSLWAEWTRKA